MSPTVIGRDVPHDTAPRLLTSSPPLRNTQRAQHTEATPSSPFPIASDEEQLFAYLNGAQSATSLGLPGDCTRIDAYLHLKGAAPQTLANLSDDALTHLCMQASVKRFGGIVGSLVDDLEGKSPDDAGIDEPDSLLSDVPMQLREARTVKKGGIFSAPPGSRRRLHAVQALISGASRKQMSNVSGSGYHDEDEDGIGFVENLVSSSMLERAYSMLTNDFRSLSSIKQGEAESESPLPDDLDIRVARRLIRTIAVSGVAKLEPMLGELIKHIKRHGAESVSFPQAVEGCYLLEYYLALDQDAVVDTFGRASSPEMPQTMQAAYFILESMTAADPDMVSKALIDTASKEGQEYSDHLVSRQVPQLEATKRRMSYTLRMVIISVLLKKGRFNMLQERLQALVSDIRQTAEDFQVKIPRLFYAKAIRSSINVALGSRTAYPLAFDIAKRFPDVWPLNLESEGGEALLRAMSECALREGKEDDLLSIVQDVLTTTRQYRDRIAPEAFCLGPEALISIIKRQAKLSRSDLVLRLLKRLRIVSVEGVVDDTIDQLFPTTFRADFIAAVAVAGLKPHSMTLYERWGAPLNYIVDSNMVQNHIKLVIQTAISTRKPAGYEVSAGSSEDFSASVKQSSACLLCLVRLFSLRPINRDFAPSRSEMAEDGTLNLDSALTPDKKIQFAYHVLFQYVNSQPLNLLDRKHFVRLSTAYYLLGQRGAAFKCLENVVRREESPEVGETVEFLRLLSQINLAGTVNLLIERVAHWKGTDTVKDEFKDKINLSRLYSPLLGKCLQRRDQELAESLMKSARANGLEDHVSLRALKGLARYAFDRQTNNTRSASGGEGFESDNDSLSLVKWVENLMEKDGWRPDPALLKWMVLRALGESLGGKKNTDAKVTRYVTKREDRKAAMMLLSLSAKHLGFIDISSARDLLRSIQHKAYILRAKGATRRYVPLKLLNMLAGEIDQLAKIVRWVQVLGQREHLSDLDEEEEDTSPLAPTGQAATVPNTLPPHLYRFFIAAYLRVNDISGAANIMLWAREEANLTFDELEHGWRGDIKGFKNYLKDLAYQMGKGSKAELAPRDILAMLSGSVHVSRTKSWWTRPTEL